MESLAFQAHKTVRTAFFSFEFYRPILIDRDEDPFNSISLALTGLLLSKLITQNQTLGSHHFIHCFIASRRSKSVVLSTPTQKCPSVLSKRYIIQSHLICMRSFIVQSRSICIKIFYSSTIFIQRNSV